MFTSLKSQGARSFALTCAFATLLFASLALQGCNATMHNALQGRQTAFINGHEIVVTDCYRMSKQLPETIKDAPDGSVHRFNPCKDADISLDHENLTVNGKFYGRLSPGDRVTLDHHKVLINAAEAVVIASN